jgi:CheY-specific phosphatase CheX
MSTLPPEVAEAFTMAAITTLNELAQLEAIPDTAESPIRGPLVIATISLLRDPPGSMSLILATDTAAALSSRYLPLGTSLTPDMIDDVAGEFANVIAGQAKTMLKGTPYHFNLSTPSVTRMEAWGGTMPVADFRARLVSECGEILLLAKVSI